MITWGQPGDKSLSEPTMAQLTDTYASLGLNELTYIINILSSFKRQLMKCTVAIGLTYMLRNKHHLQWNLIWIHFEHQYGFERRYWMTCQIQWRCYIKSIDIFIGYQCDMIKWFLFDIVLFCASFITTVPPSCTYLKEGKYTYVSISNTWDVNSLRQSDTYTRRYFNHHWFR